MLMIRGKIQNGRRLGISFLKCTGFIEKDGIVYGIPVFHDYFFV